MTTLPLLESELLYRAAPRKREALVQIGESPLLPPRALEEGEQYRFHFDMTKCIGCKCCVVACNEQNGNPAAINWRRVGEVEGGHYPFTQRFYLSMGCNHCVEPSCLIGCPVEAFTKSPSNGVVLHSADACIGCQYCTWNCSYGAVQYNAERGVVGKCDLCHNRLDDGMAPACADACPEGAISIEIVNIEQWRAGDTQTELRGALARWPLAGKYDRDFAATECVAPSVLLRLMAARPEIDSPRLAGDGPRTTLHEFHQFESCAERMP